MSELPVLTEEQWLHIKANDDARTQSAVSASAAQEVSLTAHAEFLKKQVTPLSHMNVVAVHAMQGILSNPNIHDILRDDDAFYERLVEVSFASADAMMKRMEPKP